jgi:simple sugar transport system permease protein
MRSMLANTTSVVAIILLLLIAIFTVATDGVLLSPRSVRVFLTFAPEIILMTIGMGLLLIVGEFDLSIGSIYVFSSVILAVAVRDAGMPLLIAILLALLAATAMGTLNGILVARTGITSFIVTLGGMWAYRGLMLILFGAGAIQLYPAEQEAWLFEVLTGTTAGIPHQVIWMLVIAAALAFVLHRMTFGNWVYSVGSNPRAAAMMGIDVARVRTACFAISGFLCGVAGVLQVSHSNHAIPQSGDFVMLTALASAIIGGTSLKGGRGGVVGPLLGAVTFQVISLGFIMTGVVEYWTNVMTAVAVIASALLFTQLDRLRTRRAFA